MNKKIHVKDDDTFCHILHPLLWTAIKKNDLETTRFLLERVNYFGDWLVQPMYTAIRNGNMEIVTMLWSVDEFQNYCRYFRYQYQFLNAAMDSLNMFIAYYFWNIMKSENCMEEMNKYNPECVSNYEKLEMLLKQHKETMKD